MQEQDLQKNKDSANVSASISASISKEKKRNASKSTFESSIGKSSKYFKNLTKFHNSIFTKNREVIGKNTITHALQNISKVKKEKIMSKIVENLSTSGKEIIKDVSKDLSIPKGEVVAVLNSEEFKKLLNKTIPMNDVVKAFKDDFEGRPLDRDKLYDIYTKWMGLDKQVMEVQFNKTPELEAAERILNGESVMSATMDSSGVYEVNTNVDTNVDTNMEGQIDGE